METSQLGIAYERLALRRSEVKLWRFGEGENWRTIEEAALDHYRAQGWAGAAAEGGLILTLLKAASFERLDPRNANTFVEALYAQNVAFEVDRFEASALLHAVARATPDQVARNWAIIAATAGETPAYYPRVRWEHVEGLLIALGVERLAGIARAFAAAPYDLRAGWPDLTLWRGREVRFVEVKGPGDQLHASQLRLISTVLKPLGYAVAIAEVRPASNLV
jgi:hypothetical protein